MLSNKWGHYPLADIALPDNAREYLAEVLLNGSLFLLLGAGVSRGALDLPGWRELVEKCEEEAFGKPNPEADSRSSQDLMDSMSAVKDTVPSASEYYDLIRRGLYGEDRAATNEYSEEALFDPLLVAIGSMVIRSSRGSVADVLTFNFDDVLEWYLHLYGLRPQVVTEMPRPVSTNVDVRIFHIHGFVPLTTRHQQSAALVLSHDEYLRRLAGLEGSAWSTMTLDRLNTHVFLAVGTSMRDLDFDVLLAKASALNTSGRPLGFVLDVDVSPNRQAQLRRHGVLTVNFDDYAEIPSFMLSICRRAAYLG